MSHHNALLSLLDGLQKGDPTKPLMMAEVGVCLGVLSKKLLRKLPTLTLLMIDKWAEEPANSPYRSADSDGRKSQKQLDEERSLAISRTNFAQDRRCVIVGDSLSVAKLLADESLDLVFLDADHTYNAVLADLRAWFPKVRPGGVLSGHDFVRRNDVARAVRRWVSENDLVLKKVGWSWAVEVPENAQ